MISFGIWIKHFRKHSVLSEAARLLCRVVEGCIIGNLMFTRKHALRLRSSQRTLLTPLRAWRYLCP